MKRPGEADRLAGYRAQALEYRHHSDDPAAGLAAARLGPGYIAIDSDRS